MSDGTQTAERWVYRVARRELPAIPGEGSRYALDHWERERVRESPRTPPTLTERGERTLEQRHGVIRRLLPPNRKSLFKGRPPKYHADQVQPFHGLFRLVRVVPTETGYSFAVHAVCTGPYCTGSKLRIFKPYEWIVSQQSLQGCIECSKRTARARMRAERAARDVTGLAS